MWTDLQVDGFFFPTNEWNVKMFIFDVEINKIF